MRDTAAGLAALGRGEDKMLVHMTPGEVRGLQAIALAHGGSLTINPHTGLPEAGFLKNILPALAAAAAVAILGPAAGAATGALGLGAAGTGAVAGGITGALTNKENPLMGALTGGLGGYGIGGGLGAGMQSGLFGGGAEAAGAGITGGMPAVPGNAFLQSGASATDTAASQLFGGNQLANPAVFPGAAEAASSQLPLAFPGEQYLPGGPSTYTAATSSIPTFTPNADQMSMAPEVTPSKPSFMQALGQQFPSTGSKVAGAAGVAGLMGGFDQPELNFAAPEQGPSNYRKQGPSKRPYDPCSPTSLRPKVVRCRLYQSLKMVVLFSLRERWTVLAGVVTTGVNVQRLLVLDRSPSGARELAPAILFLRRSRAGVRRCCPTAKPTSQGIRSNAGEGPRSSTP